MRPIPKKILIHSAVLRRKVSEDRFGNETLDEGSKLHLIRVEPSSKIVRDKNGAELQLAAVLFYDCRNSQPRNVTFLEDDILAFQDLKYQVKTIDSLYDERRLHHYELGLIRYA